MYPINLKYIKKNACFSLNFGEFKSESNLAMKEYIKSKTKVSVHYDKKSAGNLSFKKTSETIFVLFLVGTIFNDSIRSLVFFWRQFTSINIFLFVVFYYE